MRSKTSSDSKRAGEGGGCKQCRGQRGEHREYLLNMNYYYSESVLNKRVALGVARVGVGALHYQCHDTRSMQEAADCSTLWWYLCGAVFNTHIWFCC